MTRRADDLLTLRQADEHDVCSADESLSRVARAAPVTRRRKAALAMVAAVVVIVGVVATLVALRSDHHAGPHAGVGVSGPVTASRPASTGTRVLDLGGAHTRIPARWHTVPFRGYVGTVYSALLFVGTDRFSGRCTGAAVHSECGGSHWFPPAWTTPANGLLLMWAESQLPSSNGDGLVNLIGRRTTVDHRPAKLYVGAPTAWCPQGAASELDARVRVSADRPGHRYDMVACLGPGASTADRQAVYAMVSSLQITG